MPPFTRVRPAFLRRLFPGNPAEPAARRLYEGIVAQARQPAFYRDCAVPDSVDGRFKLVLLHLFLVLRRLSRLPEGRNLAQTLVDLTFFHFDQGIRQSGVGDLGVGPRINRMAQAYFGRAAAYERALAAADPEAALGEAVRRNVFGTVKDAPPRAVERIALYLKAQDRLLAQARDAELVAGEIAFGPPP